MTALETALLLSTCCLAGALLGCLMDNRRLRRLLWQAWAEQSKAQEESHRARQNLADACRAIGRLQAENGQILEAAIGTAKLAQLDALHKDQGPEGNSPGAL